MEVETACHGHHQENIEGRTVGQLHRNLGWRREGAATPRHLHQGEGQWQRTAGKREGIPRLRRGGEEVLVMEHEQGVALTC